MTDQSERQTLRQALRARRRSLSPLQQKRAALAITRQLLGHPQVQRSRHIAIYLPNDGEIDPGLFIRFARRLGKVFYLPVLHPIYQNRLWFFQFDRTTRLVPNRFGIPEPQPHSTRRRSARALDLVLLPLVGFDARGGRLGMGGGFYDRSFAFKLKQGHGAPYLIGLAHECQRVPKLSVASWDVPLDAVISDRGTYSAGPHPNPPGQHRGSVDAHFFGRYRLRRGRKGLYRTPY